MTTTRPTYLEIDSEMERSFCLVESAINNKGTSSEEICFRLALCNTATKALEKMFR